MAPVMQGGWRHISPERFWALRRYAGLKPSDLSELAVSKASRNETFVAIWTPRAISSSSKRKLRLKSIRQEGD